MQITEENVLWAVRKLSRFQAWQDFPPEIEGVKSRARSFVRLVHNRPVQDIMHDAMVNNGILPTEIDWEAIGIDPTQNDADWILDLIEETMERFPLPVTMREIYAAKLPPAASKFCPADILVKEV